MAHVLRLDGGPLHVCMQACTRTHAAAALSGAPLRCLNVWLTQRKPASINSKYTTAIFVTEGVGGHQCAHAQQMLLCPFSIRPVYRRGQLSRGTVGFIVQLSQARIIVSALAHL